MTAKFSHSNRATLHRLFPESADDRALVGQRLNKHDVHIKTSQNHSAKGNWEEYRKSLTNAKTELESVADFLEGRETKAAAQYRADAKNVFAGDKASIRINKIAEIRAKLLQIEQLERLSHEFQRRNLSKILHKPGAREIRLFHKGFQDITQPKQIRVLEGLLENAKAAVEHERKKIENSNYDIYQDPEIMSAYMLFFDKVFEEYNTLSNQLNIYSKSII